MHRKYDRCESKDDQTCERSLNTSSPRSGFVQQVAGANRRWRLQFRCRGSRRESAVAQLFSLDSIATRFDLSLEIYEGCA